MINLQIPSPLRPRVRRSLFTAAFLSLALAAPIDSFAASATWDAVPTTGDWNTAINWTPDTVPNGPADQAAFAVSTITAISISADTEVESIGFASPGSSYTITASPDFTLTLSGRGIFLNNSFMPQNFVAAVDGAGNIGLIEFTNSATADVMTFFTNQGGIVAGAPGAGTSFLQMSSAAVGTFTNNGGAAAGAFGGFTEFFDDATAGSGTFTNQAGTVANAFGGSTEFFGSSNAGNGSNFTNNGGAVADAFGGETLFLEDSSASFGTFITNGGAAANAEGGLIQFFDDATAANGTFTTNGGAVADAGGGVIQFFDSSTAGFGTFTNNGSAVAGAGSGSTQFFGDSTAANATITNNSGTGGGFGGGTVFRQNATAGSATIVNRGPTGSTLFGDTASGDQATITNDGGDVAGMGGGQTFFVETSTAGNATITNGGGTVAGAFGGLVLFTSSASASSATITNHGGTVAGAFGSSTSFTNGSDAADSMITNNGGAAGATGGTTSFGGDSTAGNATIIANGGPGGGGLIQFFNTSTGGTSRIEVFGNGALDISDHDAPGVTIGSLEGDGNVFLRANNLTIGSNNMSTTFSGVIQDGVMPASGGALTKIGTGTLVLSGNNTYSGNTTIDDGSLIVDGSTASPSTFVNAGGLLGGTGTVGGFLSNGGVVSPGSPEDSLGTLTANGSYSQDSSATLRIQIGGTAPGQHDLLQMAGGAGLDGTLQLLRFNNFQPLIGDEVIILTAGTAVSGQFSTVTNDFPGLIQPQVFYDPQDVRVVFVLGSFGDFADDGGTPNQMSVGDALDEIASDPDAAALVNFLGSIPLPDLAAALDVVAPDELTALFEIGISSADLQAFNIENRLQEIRNGSNGFSSSLSVADPKGSRSFSGGSDKEIVHDGGGKGVMEQATAAPSPDNRWGFFVSGSGQFVDVDEDFNSSGYEFDTLGVSFGLDYRLNENFALGLMGGYAHTEAELIGDGNIDVSSGKIGLYGTWFQGGAYLNGLLEGGLNYYDTDRQGLLDFARGDTEGAEFSALLGGGYDFECGNWTIGPIASIQYTSVYIDDFTESGSLAPLRIDSQSEEALRSRLGGRLAYRMQMGSAIVRPEIRAQWKHEFLDDALAIESSFAGIAGGDFTVHGPKRGSDSALVSAGVNVQWSPNCQAFVNYQTELGRDNYEQQSVSGGLRLSF